MKVFIVADYGKWPQQRLFYGYVKNRKDAIELGLNLAEEGGHPIVWVMPSKGLKVYAKIIKHREFFEIKDFFTD